MRTPVASKNAFATAEPTAVPGGSPEPVEQPALVERGGVAGAHIAGRGARDDHRQYWPGWTLISVTVGCP